VGSLRSSAWPAELSPGPALSDGRGLARKRARRAIDDRRPGAAGGPPASGRGPGAAFLAGPPRAPPAATDRRPDTTLPFSAGLIQWLYRGPMGMNRTFKTAVAVLMLAVSFAGSVAAGPFEDAEAAHKKGDYATALRLVRPLAEKGDARAQARLGFMYSDGQGVPKDDAAALSWYRKAAEQGDAIAQITLGAMYFLGLGVPQDYAATASWYRKAAEQGDAKAQLYLGGMYINGQGVPRDDAAAVSWYRKAAERGLAKAQFNLGVMYAIGDGVPQDYVTAHMWFNLAAAGGDKDAAKGRYMAAAQMTPAQTAEAQKLAREWKPPRQHPRTIRE
jgi:uncharacterized protein